MSPALLAPIFRPFSVLLISARGEIACRIMRTARQLGIRTVAVYSDADKNSMHVRAADSAYRIGGPMPTDSYLHATRILDAARVAGAGAVHPGYGFLSENPNFAQACAERDLVFVGPSAEVIRTMGSKSAARETVASADVPVVPGYHGADQSDEALISAAEKIGYPVMVKPVMGGGGKGMHVVAQRGDLRHALKSARHEALGAFGDSNLLLEKFIATSRHVEVQVFGDSFGNVYHLHERDCSVQRRHQKIIEEAPAPLLNEDMRTRMHDAAVATAQKVGYVGAGTVEFLVDTTSTARNERHDFSGEPPASLPFYFLEMNTRLQVEHPVTEEVTGVDLVEWQLKVASGQKIPVTSQADIKCRGSAIEARIYAESPEDGFLPQAGAVRALDFGSCKPPPDLEATTRLRVDAGVESSKDEVSVFYDPMIAKVIAHGQDRDSARRRLSHSLSTAAVFGPRSNTAFCARVLNIPEFVSGGFDTGMLSRNEKLALSPTPDASHGLCMIAVALRAQAARKLAARAPDSIGRNIDNLIGFRVNEPATFVFNIYDDKDLDMEYEVIVHGQNSAFDISISSSDSPAGKFVFNTHLVLSEVEFVPGYTDVCRIVARFGSGAEREHATIFINQNDILLCRSHCHSLDGDLNIRAKLPDISFDSSLTLVEGDGLVARSPMPGRIVQFAVKEGQVVANGDILFQVEAMKCLHTVTSSIDGTVSKCNGSPGDVVDAEMILVELKAKDK